MKKLKIVAISITILTLIFSLAIGIKSKKEEKSISKLEYFDMDFVTFHSWYEDCRKINTSIEMESIEDLLKGQRMLWSGIVDDVKHVKVQGYTYSIRVKGKSSYLFDTFLVYFDETQYKDIINLKKGDNITIEATYDEYFLMHLLVDGKIIK